MNAIQTKELTKRYGEKTAVDALSLHIAPGEIHWVNPARELTAGQSARFSVRIRYRQPLQGARLFVRDEGAYLVFDRPQRGITPGQFAAWYDGDQLVGSGVIEG